MLDIVPLPYSRVTREWATQYFHWFFLIQPAPFPETLIGNSAEFYLRSRFLRQGVAASVFTPEAVAEYLRCFKDPATIHATCEDYRAGATIDIDHAGRRRQESHVSAAGALGRTRHRRTSRAGDGDLAREGRQRHGQSLPAGHFLPEEVPTETLAELMPFLM